MDVVEPKCRLSFSIESILAPQTTKPLSGADEDPLDMTVGRTGYSPPLDDDKRQFSWLQCTRYKPPKICRNKKKESIRKRKLGRNPRVPFSQHQVRILEEKFIGTHYLSSVDVAELSANLILTETRVKIWFQNRRARERRDREGQNTRQCPSDRLLLETQENNYANPEEHSAGKWSPTSGQMVNPSFPLPFFNCGPATTFPSRPTLPFYAGYC